MFSMTRFGAILNALPRGQLDRFTRQTHADYYDKCFKPYDHLVALLYGQFSSARSLRELETGLNAQAASHYHLGIQTVRRSTLADANQRRPVAFFKALAEQLMTQVSRKMRGELRQLLYALDSTPIQLKGRGFDWTDAAATHRNHGLKVHLMIALPQHNPVYLNITDPNVNDVTDAKRMVLAPDATYVMDKGYCDYGWWYETDIMGSHFVTRFKRNAGLKVVEQRTPEGEGILEDAVVTFSHRSNRAKHRNPYYGKTLRRIRVEREGKPALELATNDMTSPATHIAALYKQRWQIELFFKWIKQNLKLKRFLGRSRNAVMVQIYAAIIGYLLLWLYRHRLGRDNANLYLLLAEIKATLFQPVLTQRQREYRRRRQEQQRIVAESQGVLFS